MNEQTKEFYFKEINPYIKDMVNLLKSKDENNKVVSQRMGYLTYTLLEAEGMRRLYIRIGSSYSTLLIEVKHG